MDRRLPHNIRLLPQEKSGSCKFEGRFVVTSNALREFGPEVIAQAFRLVKLQVASNGGMDWIQVLEINGERLWLIDDGGVVTALLPEDY